MGQEALKRITFLHIIQGFVIFCAALFGGLYFVLLCTLAYIPSPFGFILQLLGLIIYGFWIHQLVWHVKYPRPIEPWPQPPEKLGSFDGLFPPTLFQSFLYSKRKVCFGCGSKKATAVLRTQESEVAPLCTECAANWNCYGYDALKKIKPRVLFKKVMLYSLKHPFTCQPFWRCWMELSRYGAWAGKMKAWLKQRKEQ